jgi:anti-sigma regulatory factor (Ser/Thr protein kinase)
LPEGATETQRWQLQSPAEVSGLRGGLYRALTGRAMRPDGDLDEVPERVVLVASELATNAIAHGLPPTTVRLLHVDGRCILDVADHDLTDVPELADSRPPGAGGLGLQLALKLSLEVGWYATDTTKHVWAAFPA